MKKKSVMNPKTALMTSVLSMLLCITMFVGTTYAWFSSGFTNTQNNIMAGTLDVVLEYYDPSMITPGSTNGNWVEVTEDTKIFDPDAKYEPGYTEVVYLRVVNKGSLALKYQLGVSVNEEQIGINKDGETFKLSDYVMFGVAETDVGANTYQFSAYNKTDADRKAARDSVKDTAAIIGLGYRSKPAVLNADTNKIDYLTMVVYMPEEVGNEANAQPGKEASINLAIDLFAVQTQYEDDSFGIGYDKNAELGVVPSAIVKKMNVFQLADINQNGTFQKVTILPSFGLAGSPHKGHSLECAYEFTAQGVDDTDPYAEWVCDYFISFDRPVSAGTMGLAGQYASFSSDWIYFDAPIDIPANLEIPLLDTVTNGGMSNWTYKQICEGVQKFACGAYNNEIYNVGTTMTVELRLTNPQDANDYKVIGTYSHTFKASDMGLENPPTPGVTEYQGVAS